MIGWGFCPLADFFTQVLVAEVILGIPPIVMNGSNSALLFETLKAHDDEQHYTRNEGWMNGFCQTGEACGAIFSGLLYEAAPLLQFLFKATFGSSPFFGPGYW